MAALSAVGVGHALRGWLQPLRDAGVIPPETRRIIIDIPSEDVVKVYYECYADKRMFTIDLVEILKGTEAIGIAEVPEKT